MSASHVLVYAVSMFRLFRALITFAAIGLGWVSAEEIYYRYGSSSFVLPGDLVDHAQSLRGDARLSEAKLVAEFAAEHPELGDAHAATRLAGVLNEELDSYWSQIKRFTEGAISGEPKDLASLLGSLSLDFFVVGDIRDLTVQGWKTLNDGNGDTLVMGLSAVGLATTLSPQFDWIPSMLKAFKRSGKLSAELMKNLHKMSSAALRTGNFKPLRSMFKNLGRAADRLGPGPLSGMMKNLGSPADIKRIANAARIDAKGTYILGTLFGIRGVKSINKEGSNVGRLVAKIRPAARVLKAGDKSIKSLPDSWILTLLSLCLFIVMLSVTYSLYKMNRTWKIRKARFASVS